ncbi:MAG: hypothetical protein M3R67_07435 [Acidobacteriota bacterium]|nr:hypothetical protein [Acidobacteriota bacterium]
MRNLCEHVGVAKDHPPPSFLLKDRQGVTSALVRRAGGLAITLARAQHPI